MHRLTTILLAAGGLTLLAGPAQAQVELGLVGGGTLATYVGDDAPDVSAKPGGIAGALLSFPLTGPLRLETGALWQQRRTAVEVDDFRGGTLESVTGLAYIELPLTLELGMERGPWRMALKGGPSLALNVKEPEPVAGAVAASPLDTFDYRDTDLGMGIGAALGYRSLFLDGRYTVGLESAVEGRELEPRVFSLVAGVRVPVTGEQGLFARR
ncbi:MAG TPA: porin family protein [Longimicrobiales bacterium]|nr:porin family protein [Longimicrobiales bacterium]